MRFHLCRHVVCAAGLLLSAGWIMAEPTHLTCWNVDDLKSGMKGTGRTVMRGAAIEEFQVEILGVLKNTSPGRDLVLARLSGLKLETIGVIAGMSGSPVTIDGKLVGAVSYAWPYGKEPIAGITPFSQMHQYVADFERRDLAAKAAQIRIGLKQPVEIDGRRYDSVTVASGRGKNDLPTEGLFLTPLRAPIAAAGFSQQSLSLLRQQFPEMDLNPVQTGSAGKTAGAGDVKIEPGGSLCVALIRGDFDMSGIGTVTHVEGSRVYGWGHPFMSLGSCELPLMTGHVVVVYPRLSVSFKMGTPLKAVGTVNADVSTCIAGWLGKTPDMLPMAITVLREPGGESSKFNVEVVRHKQVTPGLVFAALTNSIDTMGELPDEMTAAFRCRISIAGKPTIEIRDTFAGSSYSGTRAPTNLFMPVSMIVQQLLAAPFEPIRITKIECDIEILPGRRLAELEGTEVVSDVVRPGESLTVKAFLKPYRGAQTHQTISLPIPADLPEGSYIAQLTDGVTASRAELRANPQWSVPESVDALIAGLRTIAAGKRTHLVLRVALPPTGVTLDGQALTDLPPSMVQLLGKTKRTTTALVGRALRVSEPTGYVVQANESIRFTVSRAKR